MLPCKVVKSPFSLLKASELINIAYEASSTKVCQIVGDYFNDESSVIDLDKLESHAINYVLTEYKGHLCVGRSWFEILIDYSLQQDIDVNQSLEDTIVRYLNSVRELCIRGTYINSITQIVSNSKTLKILHIDGYKKLNTEFNCLAHCKNALLQNFRVSHSNLDLNNLDAIGEMLSNNKSIKFVDFSYSGITDEGIKRLVHHLMNNNTLQHINLSSNSITADGITHLSKLITRECSALTSIELSDNPLRDKGVNLLLQSLPLGIEHIGLCDVQMTPLSCQSLGNALHKVTSISFDQLIDFEIVRASSNQDIDVTD